MPERADELQRTVRLLASLLIVAAVGFISFSLIRSDASPERVSGTINPEPPSSSVNSSPAGSLPVDFYTTNFPLAENPLSEGNVWANGKSTGIDWQDVGTMPER